MKKTLLMLITTLLVGALPVWAAEEGAERVEASVAPDLGPASSAASAQARRDMQRLVDEGINALAPELVEKSTFYPFAAVLGHDSEIRLIGVPAAERSASPEQMLAALVKKIQALAAKRRIRAAAYFMDYVAQRQDTGFSQPGIRVELHHRLPDAMSAFIPYSITSDKKLRLLTPQYRPGKNLTFNSQ